MSPNAFKTGLYYSNGAYGRNWGVRMITAITTDEDGETRLTFKGVAGTCRRKAGECSAAEFARWAKYQVVLCENDWKRVADD
jgi:hypothetical protein